MATHITHVTSCTPGIYNWIITGTNLLGIIPVYKSWRNRRYAVENYLVAPLITGIIISSSLMHLSEQCYGLPGVCLTRWYWNFLRADHALCTMAFGLLNYNYGRSGRRYTYKLMTKYAVAMSSYLWAFQPGITSRGYLISHVLFHIFAYSILSDQI